MARETIYASGSTQTANTGNQNTSSSLANAYDGSTSTLAGLIVGDSTGTLSTNTHRLTASSTKTKTWAKSRAYGKYDCLVQYPNSNNNGTTNDPYSGYVTAQWLYSGTNTWGSIGSTNLDAYHNGSTTTSFDGLSTLRSGNPTINSGTAFIELYSRAFAGVGGPTDTIRGQFYEFYVEGFSAPTITSINGGSSFTSGSNVTIIGTEFDSINEGGSNGVSLTAGYTFSSFTYNSDTSITVNNVTGSAGSCTFTLTTNGGTVAASQTLSAPASSSKMFLVF